MAEAKKAPAKAAKTAAKKTAAKTAVKKSVAKKAPAKTAAKPAPTYEEISALAHKYWQERGHHHGSDAADWLRAEKELKG
jgi:hypothetical protein